MLKHVVKKYALSDKNQRTDDLKYWLERPVEERISAVEHLRRQFYGNPTRIQKTVRVFRRPTGRKKDLADIESLDEK